MSEIEEKITERSEEVTEDEFKQLLSSSTGYLIKFISDHPEFVYKGIPLAIAVYIFSPVVIVFWQWLPWIWASYEIYRRFPSTSLAIIIDICKKYFKSGEQNVIHDHNTD